MSTMARNQKEINVKKLGSFSAHIEIFCQCHIVSYYVVDFEVGLQ